MMKILHIAPTYLPAYRYGGPILSVHALNKWLVKKGVDVTVYTTNIDGPYDSAVPLNEPVLLDGVKVFYFQGFFPRKWFYSLDFHIALAKTIKNFDLVHITSVFLAASALGAYYAKKFRKPYIISPRGSLMKEPLGMKSPLKKRVYLDLIEKRNLAGAAAIHFTVESEEKEYKEAGLPLRQSFIIPNAVELEKVEQKLTEDEFRQKYGIPANKEMVLFMSRLNWKKGLDTLIPAFKKVRDEYPNVVLVLAGDDDGYRTETKRLIAENRLKEGEDVVFTGMLLAGDKAAALEFAKEFVLPSYSENFGMSVMESVSHGTAVVVTKEVGVSSLIQENNAGIVVQKDVNDVADGMLKILKNPKEAEHMGMAGEQMVRAEFSPEAIAGHFFDEYQKLIHY